MEKPRIRKRGNSYHCFTKKAWASGNSWQEAYQRWWDLVKVY